MEKSIKKEERRMSLSAGRRGGSEDRSPSGGYGNLLGVDDIDLDFDALEPRDRGAPVRSVGMRRMRESRTGSSSIPPQQRTELQQSRRQTPDDAQASRERDVARGGGQLGTAQTQRVRGSGGDRCATLPFPGEIISYLCFSGCQQYF